MKLVGSLTAITLTFLLLPLSIALSKDRNTVMVTCREKNSTLIITAKSNLGNDYAVVEQDLNGEVAMIIPNAIFNSNCKDYKVKNGVFIIAKQKLAVYVAQANHNLTKIVVFFKSNRITKRQVISLYKQRKNTPNNEAIKPLYDHATKEIERIKQGFGNRQSLSVNSLISSTFQKTNKLPHKVPKLIVLDPGHGGDNYGIALSLNKLEKNETLSFTRYLQKELNKAGQNVILTRTKDVTLSKREREEVFNLYDPFAFISIHVGDCVDGATSLPAAIYVFSPSSDLMIEAGLSDNKMAQAIEKQIEIEFGINKRNRKRLEISSHSSIMPVLKSQNAIFINLSCDLFEANNKHNRRRLAVAISKGISDGVV